MGLCITKVFSYTRKEVCLFILRYSDRAITQDREVLLARVRISVKGSSHQVLELNLVDVVDSDGRVQLSEREKVLVLSRIHGDEGDAGQAEVD